MNFHRRTVIQFALLTGLLLGSSATLSEPKKILAPEGSPMAHKEEDLAILLKLEERIQEVASDKDAKQ